ncbi:MAG TPA: Slp family lipoprotein [Lysobacter sp.]|jgi:outer membrane lipoprotein|nr:Slp family lipoprotein [Lysobacter sp.]
MLCRIAMIGTVALALAACVTQPTPLQGEYTTVTPRDAATTDATGQVVRWGGRIVQTEPQPNRTCFEVVATQLDTSSRPYWSSDVDDGRFIACRTGFYDPAIFEPNREVTFTGRIEGYETRKIGGYDYRFPHVAADVVYLWPMQERVDVLAYPAPLPWWGYW